MEKNFNTFLSVFVKFFKNGFSFNIQIDLPSSYLNKISTTYNDYWKKRIKFDFTD